MTTAITFILPTQNRKHFVRRAIDSCLACESDAISPRVIVIDGESHDGTFDDLKNAYGGDPRVQLLQNSRGTGFMNTCFQGVDLVKSRLVTFMYDDDVLSPFFGNMISELVMERESFIMGYGAEYAADGIYPFKPIAAYRAYTATQLLLAYFGRAVDVDFTRLPVSPICCVTHIDLLQEWVTHVNRFSSHNAIRRHFMLRLNIGPDFMIYLLSLLKQTSAIPVAVAVVAQFSVHPASMSVRYGSGELSIGYWLARIWAFEYLCQAGRRSEAAMCAAAIVLNGVRILVTRLIRFKTIWAGSMVSEMAAVLGRAAAHHLLLRTVAEGCLQFVQRLLTRPRPPIPA
jgi:glycosyltransferase involved in cell wall biosynthesis